MEDQVKDQDFRLRRSRRSSNRKRGGEKCLAYSSGDEKSRCEQPIPGCPGLLWPVISRTIAVWGVGNGFRERSARHIACFSYPADSVMIALYLHPVACHVEWTV